MAVSTPHATRHESLAPLAARYVDVGALPWQKTPYDGIDIKVLMDDPQTGLSTALFRWAPGSELPLHEHTAIEQTYVLEGSFEDEEGIATAGNFVWRPAGSRHVARSADGALVLAFFLAPNQFLAAEQD